MEVFTSPKQSTILDRNDILRGDPVIPGFEMPLVELLLREASHQIACQESRTKLTVCDSKTTDFVLGTWLNYRFSFINNSAGFVIRFSTAFPNAAPTAPSTIR